MILRFPKTNDVCDTRHSIGDGLFVCGSYLARICGKDYFPMVPAHGVAYVCDNCDMGFVAVFPEAPRVREESRGERRRRRRTGFNYAPEPGGIGTTGPHPDTQYLKITPEQAGHP